MNSAARPTYEADLTPETDTPEKVQEKIDAAMDAEPQEEVEEDVSRVHTFMIDMWSRYDKVQRKGTFVNNIMTPGMELKRGAIRSQLLSACTSNIDFSTSYRAEQIAHLIVSLSSSPKWFDPKTCEDRDILVAVYEEVASHEARFWQEDEE